MKNILKLILALAAFISSTLYAQNTNTVIDGYARFQVLSPSLIRLEYASDANFQDTLTFNVVNRNFRITQFDSSIENGWRIIETNKLKLSYKQNSGPFSSNNLSIILKERADTITPIGNENLPCMLNTICEAESAFLSGGASINTNHSGYSGTGFVDGYTSVGSESLWTIYEIPQNDEYTFSVSCANAAGGDGQHKVRTLSVIVNGENIGKIEIPKTSNWDSWAIAQININLKQGQNTIGLKYNNDDSGNVNLDYMTITNTGDDLPQPNYVAPTESNNLGGYRQSLDGVNGPTELNDGLLSRDGWYFIDDKATELWTDDNWIKQRSINGIYLDGYFFGYGSDYKQGLNDLAELTGKSPILPKWAFGNWFSRYCPYSDEEYKEIVANFRSRKIPLDVLVIDTDWKSPNSWNGWGWNSNFFPNSQEFMDWTANEGLKVTFNIHANINDSDPKFEEANKITNNSLIATGGTQGFSWITSDGGRLPLDPNATMYNWDWTRKDHADSYFSLHEPLEQQGVDFWWLDDWSDVNWINHLYAQRMKDKGKRPVYFSRIRGDNPWAEHRSTIHFTGDSEPTWKLLKFIPKFTISEGNIGMPYISHDIGSHHGGYLDDDMYIRWVQMGTFMPIMRLHSSHCGGLRLPWEYGSTTEEIASKFLQLRNALVPYLYTVAHQAHHTGLPMVRGMYLDFPDNEEAYNCEHQYMFGDQILVAPVTSKGESVSMQVWFPTSGWINMFTGETYTNEGVYEAVSLLENMPVFVKAGGIIPLQPYTKHNGIKQPDSLIFKVFPGNNGSFNLYEDEGKGQAYLDSAFAQTFLQYNEAGSEKIFTINATTGNYKGIANERSYLVEFANVAKPTKVSVNDNELTEIATDLEQGWVYNEDKLKLSVIVNKTVINNSIVIKHNAEVLIIEPNQAPIADAGDDIELDDTDGNGIEEVTLNGTNSYDPDGSIVEYRWVKNSSTIANEANPTINLPVGSNKLTLLVTDDKGAISSDEIMVKINETTSINTIINNGIKVYPSPTSDIIHIESSQGSIDKIKLFNNNGAQLCEISDSSKIDLSTYKNGLYIVKIIIDGKEFNREVIKN